MKLGQALQSMESVKAVHGPSLETYIEVDGKLIPFGKAEFRDTAAGRTCIIKPGSRDERQGTVS